MTNPPAERKILVNAARVGDSGGLQAFTAALLRCVAKMPGTRVAAVVGGDDELPAGVERVRAPAGIAMLGHSAWLRSLRGYLYARRLAREYRDWRVISTTHLGLPGHRRQILTVHDLRPRAMPDSWVQSLYFHWMLPRELQCADGVLTVSETSKAAIAQTYGVALENIYVVPNSVRTFQPAAMREERPYLLMVNATYRHKNAGEVLEHHALWAARYRLKILAGEGSYRDGLKTQVQRLGLGERVDFLSPVTDEELAALYTHAAALVYPSLMEGFGLPPAEAMAYGTPVIVSDIPVFHEVLGDAPLFVRLGDTASWKQALDGIDAARTPERVALGRNIAGQYTQERMCAALNNALRIIWG